MRWIENHIRKWLRRNFGFPLVLVAVTGCVGPEAKQQIRDNAASSAADDRDAQGGKLSQPQLLQSIHDGAKAWQTLNLSINGVPIPAAYADAAPATSSSK